MDRIIKKISEIEAAASSVMEHANQEKKAFAEKMDASTRAFDAELNAQTEAELLKLRGTLEADMNSRLAAQKAEAEQTLRRMETNYETHHQEYARELFQALIRE